MKVKSITGKVSIINQSDYLINWDHKISAPQRKVTDFLKPFWFYDLVLAELRIPSTKLRLDIVNISKKIIIEVSPDAYHVKFNKFLHKDRSGFLKKIKSDESKRLWSEANDFKFIELYDSDINNISVDLMRDKFELYL